MSSTDYTVIEGDVADVCEQIEPVDAVLALFTRAREGGTINDPGAVVGTDAEVLPLPAMEATAMNQHTTKPSIREVIDLHSDEQVKRIDPPFDDYWVTSHGRVVSAKRPNNPIVLKQQENTKGYLKVELHDNSEKTRQKTFRVHRLVADAFMRDPEDDEEIRHLDGNPKNNREGNLSWGTRSENVRDAVDQGTHFCPMRDGDIEHPKGTAKLDEPKVLRIRKLARDTELYDREIAEKYGISRAAVNDIVRGVNWSDVGGPIRGEDYE